MLKIENLTKTFGNHQALDHISTTFPENKTTVIVGPSGSGKSTLLRSLNFLEKPESGHYHFDDLDIDLSKPVSSSTILNIRRQTEMVFQGYNLFPHLSVIKNVMEGPIYVLHKDRATAKKEAAELLAKVGLAEKADVYPAQLSGGQAQRVAIARSLAMHPEYIFLDEPTSALDPELELEVLKVLLQIAKEKQSMIIVTHNLAFAKQVADKIIFVEDGKILFDGSEPDFFGTDNQRILDFISAMTFSDLEE
ncbi:amino acid ABC transporter ATP-binding protein [Lentilactobacillus parafarraginis]|uniref:Arginine ABC transporter, ATP-binding protein ArtM n=2 Tax=Lentilactobacillus parafarraginis TaxID=390842 RepID=A0A0R1YWQ3_9LACO|nr:amino acid ABC transporter ATP-binding protein [Lentilactobacillus parafarraginis]KRM44187.1 arginine ABC transporter, ATP-binding protein ArtM [Lentilactobacillus parafarraginis DSM 18390 = JCM 14109]TLQ21234.1 amino acid ABC transporter ATP-binding protein [Lentilactobacillus parafarraginis]